MTVQTRLRELTIAEKGWRLIGQQEMVVDGAMTMRLGFDGLVGCNKRAEHSIII